jgi:Nidogen-like/HYR domain
MKTGMLNRNGALVLGLCALAAGCGDLQAGETYGSSQQMEQERPDTPPEPGAPDDPAPDSVEYEQAKMALVEAPTTGSEDASDPADKQEAPEPGIAIVQDLGCQARSLGRSDDGSTARITLPFSVNFFGTTQNSVFINNNGNITFNAALSSFTPFTINSVTPPIIAPFFADVDTRNTASGIVQFSDTPILFDGRQAFCVSWPGVGYFSSRADKLNTFQLLLVDRSDTGAGNFDIVMNYDRVLWETGDANGGVGGLGGTPAGAGISLGNGDPTAFFQLPGSLVRNALLDSNAATGLSRASHFSTVPGRHIFAVRGGKPVTDERITLAPVIAFGQEGRTHTVTATLANDRGTPLANRAVTFRIVSGPNASASSTVIPSDAGGLASFTYTGAGGPGQDQIQGSFVKTTGQPGAPEVTTMNWLRAPRPPVAVCRNVALVATNTCSASASVENGSFDPDGDLIACTQSPGPVFGIGATPVTLSCTDRAGLTGRCTGVVTIQDLTAPVITCPAGQTGECVAGAATLDVPNATAGDLCSSVTITGPAGTGSFPLGTSSLTFSAADDSGNTASCTTSVTVVDTTRPTLTCPAPITAECTGDHAAQVDVPSATASDACSSVALTGAAGPSSFPTGTTTIGFTAADTSGNTATCASEVTVADTTAPAITCAAPVVAECTGNSSATVDVPNAAASDVCGGVAVTGPAGAASYPLGTTPVGFGATDDFGNASSCATSVTVADTIAPVFDPGSLGTRTVLGSCNGAPVSFTLPTATDGCQAVTVTCTPLPGDSLGANTVTCTATDGSGNDTQAAITVNVLAPLRLAFQAPLSDDNVADDINTDADVANMFEVKRTIPNQVKVFACSGADVTTAIAAGVTLRLTTSFRDDTSGNAGTAIVPTFTGVGDAGGVFVLTGDHFHYNQKTDSTSYPAGSVNNTHYFQNVVTLTYNAAPSIVAGQEDARLESK